MGQAIAFYVIAACILGFAVLVVSTRDTVHSVLFLVLDFLFVAALYVLLGAQFLAAIQVLVYAGGIVVLHLFVVMLVNLKRPPEAHQDPHRRTKFGFGLAVAVLVELDDWLVQLFQPGAGVRGPSGGDARVGEHRGSRVAALHELSDPVRNCLDAAARGDDWSDSV